MSLKTQHSFSCALVLAAGKGTRMNSELPKVLMPLAGKTMLRHVLENLVKSGIKNIVIVVGYKKDSVIESLKDFSDAELTFVEQKEQKGTAHAVLSAKTALEKTKGNLLVTNGDMPLIRPETYKELLRCHIENNYHATVLSSINENPTGYGRLVRDKNGELTGIVEEKDADEKTKKITEINSGAYVFETPSIFSTIHRIESENAQNEYYLPDAIALIHEEKMKIGSYVLENSNEAIGANSREDLNELERVYSALAIK